MSQNRKTLSRSVRLSRKNEGGTLFGIFIGLILGALIAVGAAWYFTNANPFQTTHPVAPHVPTGGQAPMPLPGKPGDRPVVKPDFEFYRILPQGESNETATTFPVTPDDKLAALPPATKSAIPSGTETTQQQRGNRSYLQVGSFSKPSDAEFLKAKLALSGIESNTQSAQLSDGRTVFRVRVGPYSKPEEIQSMRARLAQAGFDATVTRATP